MNNITNILNIEDEDILILDIRVEGNIKYIEIIKVLVPQFCPCCGSRMHSKGIYPRSVNHSMLIDGFFITIILYQRKWLCTNDECRFYMNDRFIFVDRYKHQSNIIPLLIINALRNSNRTCADVARMFNVSDTYVHDVFMSFVDPGRLALPTALAIDEVFLNIDKYTKFSCVLMNFETGEIVDILRNRWQKTLDAYFYSISREERCNVKYVICDMYDTYVGMASSYFPKSIVIIDSFHVISYLNNLLNKYLLSVKKKYMERDKEILEEKNRKNNTNYKNAKKSKEVNLLNYYQKFFLGDIDNMYYCMDSRYNKILCRYANDKDVEEEFLKLDDKFEYLRDLKQIYLRFNSTVFTDEKELNQKFYEIIDLYKKTDNSIFMEFARLLKRYDKAILASFHYLEAEDGTLRRMSNGPLEGFNRNPKDMKRDARGFEVFEYIRARLLFSNRKNESIRGVPKTKNDIPRSKKPYRKKKEK